MSELRSEVEAPVLPFVFRAAMVPEAVPSGRVFQPLVKDSENAH